MIPNLRSVPAPPVRPVRLLVLRTRSLLLALAGAVILLLAGAPGASAHAELQTTSPANGAVLDKAPATVSVQFTEGVQVTPDGLRRTADLLNGLDSDERDAPRRVIIPPRLLARESSGGGRA